ncbi:MAG TPA: aldehyde ferredoxin oxidoreductase family protein [Candidatus Lokiarchaeia archaeon]|nr:aldehyde ferredoxin oxidoreductase family protein [Candidatus Lokiarchaeia archaeon]
MYSVFSKLLRIDVTSGKIVDESIPDAAMENYIGGRGLGVKYICDEVDPTIDPLSTENKLVFATGPMTGTMVPTSGRFSCATKSPLTNTIFDCNSGGSFGPNFKNCGYDGLIVEGKSENPVYILIIPGHAEIQDATDLWGKSTKETTDLLRERHGKTSRVACIGQAGENLVLYANIMNDLYHALGRGGLGAVMGSKKIKAIVVNPGERDEHVTTTIANPELLKVVIEEINKRLNASPVTGKGLRIFGTAQLVNLMNAMGIFPINNFQRGTDPRADNLSGEQIIQTIFKSKEACYMCPIGCGRLTATAERSGKGPEYESDWALGADCGIFNLEKVTNANYECNEIGIDTITAGSTIACAMELNEAGKLPSEWADVIFGNEDILIDLVRKIGFRDGIGNDLAEGSQRLAMKYGAPELAMQVKGLELPAYDPRGAFGMALAYATSNRGACHLRAYTIGPELLGLPKLFDRFSFSDKADLVVKQQNMNAFYDSCVACKFTGMGVPEDYYSRAIQAITGLKLTVTDAEHIGERIWNLERLFNLKAGFTRADDALPPRFSTPLEAGASKGKVPNMRIMLNMYYQAREWSVDGVPSEGVLQKLGIEG